MSKDTAKTPKRTRRFAANVEKVRKRLNEKPLARLWPLLRCPSASFHRLFEDTVQAPIRRSDEGGTSNLEMAGET